MNKLALGALALSAVASVSTATLAFDACPAGSYNTTASPDGTSYSTLFDSFVAFAGDIATCPFSFPLSTSIPTGNIVVYSADYRGGYDVAAGEELEFSVEHNGTSDGVIIPGPDADDTVIHSDLVASSNGEVTSTAELDLADATDGFTFAAIDSADYTELGRITIATDQTAMVAHLDASASLLTGGDHSLEGGNEVGFFGAYGSYMLGASGRYNLAEGFSILGGVSLIDQAAGSSRSSGVLGAVAVRYVEPGINTFRPIAEGGIIAGALQTTFPNVASAVPTGLGTFYAKGGLLTDLAPNSRLAVTGTLAETALGMTGFTQTFPAFSVNVPAQTGFFTTVKGNVSLTTDLAPTIDLTAEAGAGYIISHNGITATIPGLGTVSGSQNTAFVDYGLRLGWEPTDMLRVETFVQGSAGPDIAMHNQIGVGAKLKF